MARISLTESIDIESGHVTAVTRTYHTVPREELGQEPLVFHSINVHLTGGGPGQSYSVGRRHPDETLQQLKSRAEAERQRVMELVWPNSMKEDAPPPLVDLDTYTT